MSDLQDPEPAATGMLGGEGDGGMATSAHSSGPSHSTRAALDDGVRALFAFIEGYGSIISPNGATRRTAP